MTGIIKSFIGAAKKGPLSLRDLEGLRKRLGSIAGAVRGSDPLDPRLSSRARKEARDFYAAIDATISSNFPRFHQALRSGKRLRDMERELSNVNVTTADDATLASFWRVGRNDVFKRLESLEEFGAPEDVAAVKSWLLNRLIERSVNAETGLVQSKRMQNLFEGENSIFNRQIFDRALPGVRREMLQMAKLSERFKQGIAAPEGSQTATRASRQSLLLGGGVGAAGFIAFLLSNPYLATTSILGASGVAWTVQRAMKSMVDGAIGNRLSTLAQGGPPTGLSRLPAALTGQGGVSGLGRTGIEALQELGTTAGQGAREAAGQ